MVERGRTWLASWLLVCIAGSSALDVKWTPNGEAPAPFSTKARQQMGMDPAAMAGQASRPAVRPKGVAVRYTLGALAMMYIANNWKMVLVLQDMVMKLLEPFLNARKATQAAATQQETQAQKEAARKARIARLKSE